MIFTETDDFLGTVKEEVGALVANARPRAFWFVGVLTTPTNPIGMVVGEVSLYIDDRVYQWRETYGGIMPGDKISQHPGWILARKEVDELQRVLRERGHILVQGRIRDIITQAN